MLTLLCHVATCLFYRFRRGAEGQAIAIICENKSFQNIIIFSLQITELLITY